VGCIFPDGRATVLQQQCGQCRRAGRMKGRLIRAQTSRSKRISCKGQPLTPSGINLQTSELIASILSGTRADPANATAVEAVDIYIYIYTHTYICIYICVCVCVCVYLGAEGIDTGGFTLTSAPLRYLSADERTHRVHPLGHARRSRQRDRRGGGGGDRRGASQHAEHAHAHAGKL